MRRVVASFAIFLLAIGFAAAQAADDGFTLSDYRSMSESDAGATDLILQRQQQGHVTRSAIPDLIEVAQLRRQGLRCAVAIPDILPAADTVDLVDDTVLTGSHRASQFHPAT